MSTEAPAVNALHPDLVPLIDPQFAKVYNKYQAHRLRADQVSYETYNANRSEYTFPFAIGPCLLVDTDKVHQIPVSDPLGEIMVQVFTPPISSIAAAGSANAEGRIPAFVNYHGGGWVIGGLTSDEPWCRKVCLDVGCVIINVAYRMAPDFPHPIPATDSWAALKWVFSAQFEDLYPGLLDKTRVGIGGLSAGGNLAAVLSIWARDAHRRGEMDKLVLQLLIVPSVDVRYIPIEGSAMQDCPYQSYKTMEFAPCLPLQRLRWFCNLWLGTDPEQRKRNAEDWVASPMLAESHADLAPASIHVAEIDTLASEGAIYHDVLLKAGTPSTLKIYKGCGHPFAHWYAELDQAREFTDDTIIALKKAYGLKV